MSVFLSILNPSGKHCHLGSLKNFSDVWCPPKPVKKNIWGGAQDSTE